MGNADAWFSGKIALRAVTDNQYLSIDQSSGRVIAQAGSTGPATTLIDYSLPNAGPGGRALDFFSGATPANHAFIVAWQCWPGGVGPPGCSLMAVAPTIDGAAAFTEDLAVNRYQSAGQHQWTASGLAAMVPLRLGLGLSWAGVQVSGRTQDNLFTVTQVVPGYAAVSCSIGNATWRNADLSYVNLSNLGGRLTGSAADFTGANLQGANLSRLDLTGLKISNNVNLRDANLSGVRLKAGQDLSQATLVGINLSGVDLRNVLLSPSVDLTRARLAGAKLDGLDLSRATLDDADLTGATLAGTKLSAAKMLGTNFSKTDLTVATFGPQPAFSHDPRDRTVFAGARLPYAIISTDWIGYDLSDAAIVAVPHTVPSLRASQALLLGLTLDGVVFQPPAIFDGSDLTGISLKNTTLTAASFAGAAKLTGAILTDAQASDAVFDGATLDGARLNSTSAGAAVFDGATFRGASLRSTSLAGSSAKQATFAAARLDGAILTSADATGSSFVGAALYGAALSYARLAGADFTNAQLGAKQTRFTLPWSFIAELNGGVMFAALVQAFAGNGIDVSQAAQLTVRIPSQNWLVADGSAVYEIIAVPRQQLLQVLSFLAHDTAAVLTQAYMPDAVFTDANLYACQLSGVQWYGQSAKGDNADLEAVNFANANLGAMAPQGMVLSQARMFGAKLDGAILVNTDLSGAYLSPSATNVAASLASASLQGTVFTQAHLDSADLTNAAVALAAGVPMFGLPTTLTADLDAATVSAAVLAAFADDGYPLLDGSTITVLTPGASWQVNNGGDAPPTTAIGSTYATFAVAASAAVLPVFGASLWVTQIGSDGHLQTVQVSYEPTALSANDMTARTTCPNGEPLSEYLGHRVTWEQIMTAAAPPTPPACVPSPTHWCPQNASVAPAAEPPSRARAKAFVADATASATPAGGAAPSPLATAEALLAAYPAIIDLDAGTSAAVATLVAGLPGLNELATAISAQGQAGPAGGWATRTTVGRLGDIDVVVDTPSAATVRAALAATRAALAGVRAQAPFTGVLWTAVDASPGGRRVVEPPAAGFTWTVAHVPPRFGVVVDALSVDVGSRMCQVRLRNVYPRYAGVFAEFLDGDGRPVEPDDWNSTLPPALAAAYETATRKFLAVLAPTGRIAGVALGGGEVALQVVVPPQASGVRIVLACGAVIGWEAAAGIATTLTVILGWALPALLQAAGVAAGAYSTLLGNGAIVDEALGVATAVAGAADVGDALAILGTGLGPWLFGDELAQLRAALLELMPAAALASAAVALPWPAALARLAAGDPTSGAGLQAIAGPATFSFPVELDLVTALGVDVRPDPRHGLWPAAATTVALSLDGDDPRGAVCEPAGGPMSDAAVHATLGAVLNDRPVAVTAHVSDAGGRVIAQGRAVAAASHDRLPLELTLDEPAPPSDAALRFTHLANLSRTAIGYAWQAGDAPSATQASLDCSDAAGALCEVAALTLAGGGGGGGGGSGGGGRGGAGVLGYAWRATGPVVRSCDRPGVITGQASTFALLGAGADPQRAAQQPDCALGETVLVSSSRNGAHAAFVDPRAAAYALRRVSLETGTPIDMQDATSLGRFLVRPSDVALSDDGFACGVSTALHLLQIVSLSGAPVADGTAPTAFCVGGRGTGVGQLDMPVAVAASPAGALVVLEAGNARLQAFDTYGNPLEYFSGGSATLDLGAGHGPRSYLDLDIDDDDSLYVLSYGGDGCRAADYRVDVLAAGGAALTTIEGIAAARIAIAPYKMLYALGYGALAGVDGRVEPVVSVWGAAEETAR